MASRVRWKSYARFRAGENSEIVSKDYLSLLSYGCNGCDGEGVYAEILEFTKNVNDNIASIIVEDATREAKKGDKLPIVVYACPADGAPIKLANNQFEVAASGTGYTYADGVVTISSEATSPVEVGVEAFGKSTKLTVTVK